MGGLTRWVAVSLLALGLVAGCTDSDPDAGSSATVPKAAPTSSTTAPPADPYAVPAVIDAAYVKSVLDALEAVEADATRLILASQAFVPAAAERLHAIYGEEEFRRQTDNWADLIGGGLTGFRDPSGERGTSVQRIISGSPTCLFVELVRDYSEVVLSPPPPKHQWASLRVHEPGRDPHGLNPTPWVITAEGSNRDGSQPPDPCAAP